MSLEEFRKRHPVIWKNIEKMNEHCRELEVWVEHYKQENDKLRLHLQKEKNLARETDEVNDGLIELLDKIIEMQVKDEHANAIATELKEMEDQNERLQQRALPRARWCRRRSAPRVGTLV